MKRIFVAGAASMCCATAGADMVVFDNTDGEFVWGQTYDGWQIPDDGKQYLDITQGTEQSGDSSSNAVYLAAYSGDATPHWDELVLQSSEVGIAHDPVQTFIDEKGFPYDVQFAEAFGTGDLVGAGADYDSSAVVRLSNGYTDPVIYERFSAGHYVGIELSIDDNIHYGWIEVQWSDGLFGSLLPVRWGYETTPGVAAQVPAPGAAVALVAALGISRRRRRSF